MTRLTINYIKVYFTHIQNYHTKAIVLVFFYIFYIELHHPSTFNITRLPNKVVAGAD